MVQLGVSVAATSQFVARGKRFVTEDNVALDDAKR
jgi:hypothetical protein